jgi:ArsR family transcriptional regulator, lead/cadmium/zinc/bismuth-responsive transcriptional repressor
MSYIIRIYVHVFIYYGSGHCRDNRKERPGMSESVCTVTETHQQAVDAAKKSLPAAAELSRLSGFFKVFGDDTRLNILSALAAGELCVCDLAEVVDTTQSAVSHQLRILRDTGLVQYRREGRVVYYSLDDYHIERILSMGLEHIRE